MRAFAKKFQFNSVMRAYLIQMRWWVDGCGPCSLKNFRTTSVFETVFSNPKLKKSSYYENMQSPVWRLENTTSLAEVLQHPNYQKRSEKSKTLTLKFDSELQFAIEQATKLGNIKHVIRWSNFSAKADDFLCCG